MKSPLTEIQKDFVTLSKLFIEISIQAPDFHRKQIKLKSEKILAKYKVKKNKWPKWPKLDEEIKMKSVIPYSTENDG